MIPSCAQRSLVTGDILAGRATLGDKSAFALTVLGQLTSRVVGKPEVIAQVLTVVTTDLYPSKVAPRRFSKPPSIRVLSPIKISARNRRVGCYREAGTDRITFAVISLW